MHIAGNPVINGTNWFHDEDFNLSLPDEVSLAIAQFYGTDDEAVWFAQRLASFLRHQQEGWVLRRPYY